MGYKYLQKPSPENADRHCPTCTCYTPERTAEAQIKEASELSEGNFNLGAYRSSTWRI